MSDSQASHALTAMVVDSSSVARHRLKQVCHSLEEFDQVDQSNDLRAAVNRLNSKIGSLDIIFISSKFESEEIKAFISDAKQIEVTQDCAFVILMGVNEKGSDAEARAFLLGGDGVLFEPFSTDQLREMSALAMRVRGTRNKERLAAHLKIVVNDIFGMLGDIGFLRESEFSFSPVLRKMKKVSSVIEGLENDQTKIYYDVLINRSESGPEKPHSYPKHFRYGGKSKRARKRMQRRTLRALGYEATE